MVDYIADYLENIRDRRVPGPELDKIILMMRTMQGRMVGGSNSIRMVRKMS